MSTMSESRTRIRWMLGFWVVTVLLVMGVAGTVSAGGETESSTPTLTITEDWAVTLSLVDGPDDWWFRINWWGTCTPVNGPSITNIQGYTGGPHSVWVYSDDTCSTQIASGSFTVPDPALTATVNADRSVDLALTNGPDVWSFRISTSGTCTTVTGGTVSGIRGYQPGLWVVGAFSGTTCGSHNGLGGTTFTIPNVQAASLTAVVDTTDWTVDLSLAGGPNVWSFRINWWGTCTTVTGSSVTGIGGYRSGSHDVWAYTGSECTYQIASDSFTVPTTSVAATVHSDRSVDFALTDGPDNWWFRINYTGTCTAASGDTVTNIRGYQAGNHVVWVYADSGCSQPLASTGFTLSVVTLSAVTVGLEGRVDLVLAGGPDSWWFTVTGADTCAEARGSNVTVVGFDPGDYVIQAYPDDGCKYAMASATVTVT